MYFFVKNYIFSLCVVFLPFIFTDMINTQNSALAPDKFGPVKPRITDMHFCKGPKRVNCTDIELIKNDGFNNITLRILMKKSTEIYKTKMALWTVKKTVGNPDFTKWIDKPCTHFFLAPILRAYMHVNDKCITPKALYMPNLNANALCSELFGMKFFYGAYRSQTVVVSKTCNIACVVTEFLLENPIETKNLNLTN